MISQATMNFFKTLASLVNRNQRKICYAPIPVVQKREPVKAHASVDWVIRK